jgi:hypothetical protein
MRDLRPTLIVLLAAAALISPAAPRAAAAPSGPVPDTTGILTPWRIEPQFPCVHDSVAMIVRGFVSTPCEVFVGAEAIGPLHVRIRLQHYADRYCFAAPFQFFPVPVPLGLFPAGSHAGLVDIETTVFIQDTASTVTTQQFRFDFNVTSDCGPVPPPQPGPLPYVNSITTDPEHPCATQPTTLVVAGLLPATCGQVIDSQVIDSEHVTLTLKPYVLADTACSALLMPWQVRFPLGTVAAGVHRTEIALVMLVPDSTRTTFERRFFYQTHEFWVNDICDSLPTPPPGPLPYVTEILVGGRTPCNPSLICPDDSISVRILGMFPSDCFSFRKIEVIPSPLTVVPPLPPTVRVIVDDGGCLGRPCSRQPVPWTAAAELPAWPPGAYPLTVELARVTCSDTYPPGDLFSTTLPLRVADSCAAPAPCLKAGFEPGPGGQCNATVSKVHPAVLTFTVAPSVALAGLQGEFRLDPSDLEVMKVEAIGPAAGMLLNWTATDDGARFVLLAPSGAPIPVSTTHAWPVLRVVVAPLTRSPIPDQTTMVADNLLGSDVNGQAVPLCPPPPCVDPLRYPAIAFICAEQECDFNADGLLDIRDLVLMVHCVNAEGPCPPDAATRFDCDGDSLLAVADVLCCARDILGRPPCADCSPDSVRPEPGVSMSFGDPQTAAGVITVPLHFTGVERVGAAKLTLALPLDRYDVAGFDANSPWLALHDQQGGRLTLGLINVQDSRSLAQYPPPSFLLRLRLKPGATPGGAVTATAGEFSGTDGVTLGVHLGQPSEALPGAGAAALSANQPNPFSRETAFTLDLPQAGEVTVAIYDLRGRTVTTLHRAPLTAGPHEFRWNGTQSDGTPAPNGVYFYRAVVAGQPLSRKLILMRGN